MIKRDGSPVSFLPNEHAAVERSPVELPFLEFCIKRLSQEYPCRAIDRKVSLPYIVSIKIMEIPEGRL